MQIDPVFIHPCLQMPDFTWTSLERCEVLRSFTWPHGQQLEWFLAVLRLLEPRQKNIPSGYLTYAMENRHL